MNHEPWTRDVICNLMGFSLWVTDTLLTYESLLKMSVTNRKRLPRGRYCKYRRVVSFIVKRCRKVRWCMSCPPSAFVFVRSSWRGRPFIPVRMKLLWPAFMLRVFSACWGILLSGETLAQPWKGKDRKREGEQANVYMPLAQFSSVFCYLLQSRLCTCIDDLGLFGGRGVWSSYRYNHVFYLMCSALLRPCSF